MAASQAVETMDNSMTLAIGLALLIICRLCTNIGLMQHFLEIQVKTVTLLTMGCKTLHGVSLSSCMSKQT